MNKGRFISQLTVILALLFAGTQSTFAKGGGVINFDIGYLGTGPFNPVLKLEVVGPCGIPQNSSVQFYGKVTYALGNTYLFTNTDWCASLFSMATNGVYTAGSVASDTACTISCQFSNSGIIYTLSTNISVRVNPSPNTPPQLAAIGNRSVTAGTALNFTASATDTDVPAQPLSFSLDPGAPAGSSIDMASGLFTWLPTQVSTNTVTVRVTDSYCVSDFETIQIAVSLPSPWLTADIGTPAVAGGAGYSNSVYLAQGAGDITGASDKFRFIYQTLSADGEISARVSSVQHAADADRAGVMIRESLNANSKNALMRIKYNGNFGFERRTATGGGTTASAEGTGTFPNGWVRLVRSGSTVTAYKSADGSTWTQVGSITLSMASDVYVGLAVTSGNTSKLTSTTIDNVIVIP